MLLLSLLIFGLSGQAGSSVAPPPGPAEIYAPPAVRPYEPPSSFGRQIAEGDADATVRTRPLVAPVAVEAYSDSYELRRSSGELSYEQGVEAARVSQNARMGPLDGVWSVVDRMGQPVLDLVLSDRGGAWPVEGALKIARTDHTAAIDRVSFEGDTRIVTATLDGRPVSLRLRPGVDGWSGELTGAGPRQAVSLIRQP